MPATARRRFPVPALLLALAGYVAAGVWIASMSLGADARPAFYAAVLATVPARLVQVVVHELGHLVAGVLLGVRVRGLRLFGARVAGRPLQDGPPNHVSFDLNRPQRFLAPRMGVIALAGPLVNLVLAAGAAVPAGDAGLGWPVRAVAVAVCVTGTTIGLGNLLPFRTRTGHSDGRSALRWLVHARKRSAELAERRTVRSLALGEVLSDDTAALLAATGDERPAVAATAMSRLLAARLRATPPVGQAAAVWSLYDPLLRVVRTPGVPPDQARRLAAVPASVLALTCLQEEYRTNPVRDPQQVARIETLIDAGLAAAPRDVQLRTSLCVVRIVQERSAEGATLLVGVSPADAAAATVADAYAARALAEITLHDLDQAGRLLDAAQRLAPDTSLGRLARVTLAAAARRRS